MKVVKICDCAPVNEALANQLSEDLESNQGIEYLADFFKIISDDTRVKILYVLSKNELCVNDVAVVLNMTKSAISHQLRILKMAGQVKARRDGKYIYYSLDDGHMSNIFENALAHVGHKQGEIME